MKSLIRKQLLFVSLLSLASVAMASGGGRPAQYPTSADLEGTYDGDSGSRFSPTPCELVIKKLTTKTAAGTDDFEIYLSQTGYDAHTYREVGIDLLNEVKANHNPLKIYQQTGDAYLGGTQNLEIALNRDGTISDVKSEEQGQAFIFLPTGSSTIKCRNIKKRSN